MKNLCRICIISTVVVTCCLSIQAQPATGTWTEADFPVGSWRELLFGGGEGQPGNEIRAESPGFYSFGGATIGTNPSDVVLQQDCSDPEYLAFIYRTFYYGGILELNNAGTLWANGGDPTFIVNMGPVKNVTTKNVDEGTCDQTPEVSFDLTTVGIFDAYPDYAALVAAHYFGEPGFDGVGTPPSMFDELDEATIIIARRIPLYVKPGSCKNPVNVKSQGVIPVVVMGTDLVDLTTIDPSKVTLEGVLPSHWAWDDVGGPIEPADGFEESDCSATEIPDGFMDLVLKFSTQEVIAAIAPVEDGDRIVLTLLGETEEYPVLGQDVITILKRGRIQVGAGDPEERDNNGNHYGWTNGNGNAFGRDKNASPVLGREGYDGEETGSRSNGNANGHDKDKDKNKDNVNGNNNGKENGSDKGNGNKNGHNKGGG